MSIHSKIGSHTGSILAARVFLAGMGNVLSTIPSMGEKDLRALRKARRVNLKGGTRKNSGLLHWIKLRHVEVRGKRGSYSVWFKAGCQSFNFTPYPFDSKANARWYQHQLALALITFYEETKTLV